MPDFLLFDAAKAGKNLHKATALNAANQSLYKGGPHEALHGIAPHLFTLEPKGNFENWFVKEGWGNAWGLIVKAPVPFEELVKHFCKLLIIKTEKGAKLNFRFYDPRVLRIFLPTCDKEQLKDFFGPVKTFIMEDEDPAYALQFWLQNLELTSRRFPASELFGGLAPVVKTQQSVQVAKTESKIETTSPEKDSTKATPEPAPVEIKKRRFF